ncbi:hypothetical protein F2Q68_00044560 [Brassica cretica]|uniref:Uncharacterized protein n=2 Tax=Brassica cretica TaxID=69181 RepID=A0A8S9LQC8_BRACR|nr:hypothetical protein F2Q68_00044560 [Brassica cretica]KAF3519905.1 hypothetical protein DY000_02060796 [Brassica cretica]
MSDQGRVSSLKLCELVIELNRLLKQNRRVRSTSEKHIREGSLRKEVTLSTKEVERDDRAQVRAHLHVREVNRRSAKRLRRKNGEEKMRRHRGGADEIFIHGATVARQSNQQPLMTTPCPNRRRRVASERNEKERVKIDFLILQKKKTKRQGEEAVGTRVAEWARIGPKPSWWRFVKACVYSCMMGQ